MNSLKLDLKILDSFLILILLVLISSCQTVTVDKVSNVVDKPNKIVNPEFQLPHLENVDDINIKASSVRLDPSPDININNIRLPYLSFEPVKSPYYSDEVSSFVLEEFTLPILEEVIDEENEESTNDEVINKVVTDPEVIPPVATKPIVSKPVVTKPIVSKPVVIKTEDDDPEVSPIEVNNLKDIDVFNGKNFTIEMDQSGWLFEKEINNLQFLNKFYTNNKVLFEFFAKVPGEYHLEFSKYTEKGKSISRVKINVLNQEIIAEDKTTLPLETIVPEEIQESISVKSRLEADLENIDSINNPDEVYFKLGEIYFDEGFVKKAKEYFEYVYDNYPLSIYYDDAKDKMEYIINNFLIRN